MPRRPPSTAHPGAPGAPDSPGADAPDTGRTTPRAPIAKRTRLDPAERRRQLIDLGLKLLAERRLDDLSVDELAAAAGVSRALLFHYFGSKHGFLVAVVGAAADAVVATVEAHAIADDLRTAGPEVLLPRALGAFVDFVSDNSDLYVALVRGAAGVDPDLTAISDATRDRLVEIVTAAAAGIIPTNDRLRLAVRGYLSYVEEIVVTWLRTETGLSRDELIALLANSLLAIGAATLAPSPTGDAAR